MKMSGYELNEKDIDQVLEWLKDHKPEKANREYAISMLIELKQNYRQTGFDDPDLLEDLKKNYED